MTPGQYLIYVSFKKNDEYGNDANYSKVVIDFYSKKDVEIEPMNFEEGMKLLNQ